MTKKFFSFFMLTAILTAVIRILLAYTPFETLASFTPIGALALIASTAKGKRSNLLLTAIVFLFCSDLVINAIVLRGEYGILHHGWYIGYVAFAAVMVLNKLVVKKVTLKNLPFASLFAALVHWAIVDFGVWISGGVNIQTWQPLPLTFNGLLQAYMQGIPFVKNFFLGTIFYGVLLFGIQFVVKQLRYKLKIRTRLSQLQIAE